MATKSNTSENRKSGRALRMQKALEALLEAPTLRAAAEAAGIHRVTLYKYLKDPQFAEALAEARAEVRRVSAARLDALLSQALDVLGQDMAGERQDLRQKAAGLIVRYAASLAEHLEIIERLEALERRIEHEHS